MAITTRLIGKLGGAEVHHASIPAAESRDTNWTTQVEQGDYMVTLTTVNDGYGVPELGVNEFLMTYQTGEGTGIGSETSYGAFLEDTTHITITGSTSYGHRGIDVRWVKTN